MGRDSRESSESAAELSGSRKFRYFLELSGVCAGWIWVLPA